MFDITIIMPEGIVVSVELKRVRVPGRQSHVDGRHIINGGFWRSSDSTWRRRRIGHRLEALIIFGKRGDGGVGPLDLFPGHGRNDIDLGSGRLIRAPA